MGFVLLIIIVVAIWWIVRPFVKILRSVRKMQQGEWIDLNDLFGTPGAQRPGNAPGSGASRSGWSASRKRKRKKIDPEVGEYVKFQEIRTDATSAGASAGGEHEGASADTSRTTIVVEQQIEDAQWEEIKD